MISIRMIYFLIISFISYWNISMAEYPIERTPMNIKSKLVGQNSPDIIDFKNLSTYTRSIPLPNSDCFCSYDQLINLLLCSPSLQNSPSASFSSNNFSSINITLNDCTFFNNHFMLPKLQGKSLDYLRLKDVNHQDYLVFDSTSFAYYLINHLYITYTDVEQITMLLLSNESLPSSSLRTLYISSAYLVTLNKPFSRLFQLESITLINIHQFSWSDFQQQIIRLPRLRSIYLGEKILTTTNDIFNVLSCKDLSSQWNLSYRLIQTCSCRLVTFLQSVRPLGNAYQCPSSNQTINFIDDICQFNGKEYQIPNQTDIFCQQCLSKQCSNGTFCAESFDSQSTCLLPSRYDYETIRQRIPVTPYTKQYLLQESQEYLTSTANKTLDSIAFHSVATILIDSSRNSTENSPSEVQMFHQTLADMLSRPWSAQVYASAYAKPIVWHDLILSLDQSIKSINEDKFEFQSKPISTVSLRLPTNEQLSDTFGWRIASDNNITANISNVESSNANTTTRVYLQFNKSQLSSANCSSSNIGTNCTSRFSITSLKSPKFFCNTDRIPEYDVISIIAPNSDQHVTFYFDQKLPLSDQPEYSRNTTNSTTTTTTTSSDSFYDQLNPTISEGVCMYLNTSNMTWQSNGCSTDRRFSNGTSVTCTCEHLTMFTVFFSLTCAQPSKAFQIFSWIGCGLSILGLAMTLVMFVVISRCRRAKNPNHGVSSSQSTSTQDLRKHLMSKPRRLSMVKSMLFLLCILLILMNILIFILTFVKSGRNLTCTILSAMLYYFTLTAFIWKFFFAFQQSLFITNIYQPYWSNRTFFLIYSSLTFSLPICPLLIMFIKYQDFTFISSTCNYCWLTREFLLYGLIIPILVIVCLNMLFYLYTMIHLCLRNRQQPGLRSTKSDHSRHIQNFKIGLFFAIIMGLSWILGFLVLIPNSYVQFVGNILFCIVNSVQGFAFSLMVFCMLERKSIRKCCCFWRYKNRMKTKAHCQDISPQQLEPPSTDDNGAKIKNSYNSSIYTSSTSNGENTNQDLYDQYRAKTFQTREQVEEEEEEQEQEEEEEEEEEHVYTTLPL